MQDTPKPGVVKWYQFYVAMLAFIYVALLLAGLIGLYFSLSAPADFWDQAEMPPWLLHGYLVFLVGLCLVLSGTFLAAFFIPRKPWAWIYHLVLICIGLGSPCFLPICVPLLIYWLRPEAKAYFGKS